MMACFFVSSRLYMFVCVAQNFKLRLSLYELRLSLYVFSLSLYVLSLSLKFTERIGIK